MRSASDLTEHGMKLLAMKISNLDAARECGDREVAKEQFFETVGVLKTLSYLRIITLLQWEEFNDDLFENHYYLDEGTTQC